MAKKPKSSGAAREPAGLKMGMGGKPPGAEAADLAPGVPGLAAAAEAVARMAVIEVRLAREPTAIRDAARNFSREFASQAEHAKPSPAAERSFFKKMAAGLAELADALDSVIKEPAGASPGSVALVKAAQIARGLNEAVTRWTKQSATKSSQVVNVGIFCLAIAFLHWIGADSLGADIGLSRLLVLSKEKDGPKKREKFKKGSAAQERTRRGRK